MLVKPIILVLLSCAMAPLFGVGIFLLMQIQ